MSSRRKNPKKMDGAIEGGFLQLFPVMMDSADPGAPDSEFLLKEATEVEGKTP